MILKVIVEQVMLIGTFQQKLSQVDQQQNVDNLSQECLDQSEQVKNQVRKQLQDFQKSTLTDVNEILFLFNQQQKDMQKDHIEEKMRFQYELIKFSSKIEYQVCLAFDFNKDQNFLAVGRQSQIILYQFNNGAIEQELQKLIDHCEDITCLQFMNKSDSFISGSKDSLVIIYDYDFEKNQYFPKQILKDHNKSITCIIMSRNDDLLITGSIDKTIKFWNKTNESWSCLQTIDTKYDVYSVSLNDLEDKLISCGSENAISVMKKGSDNKWCEIQIINTNSRGDRLCFTIGDQFVFQPAQDSTLNIYQFNKEIQKFEIFNHMTIQLQSNGNLYFPCQYINGIKVLLVRHGQNVNIFQVQYDGNYQLIQSIEFKDTKLFCRLTDDGQYLVTWDEGQKEIQVRQIKYL